MGTMLPDAELLRVLGERRDQGQPGSIDDTAWLMSFARDVERRTRQEVALEAMTQESQRLGLYDENPKAAGWDEGFAAGDAWRSLAHDSGKAPQVPANPYKTERVQTLVSAFEIRSKCSRGYDGCGFDAVANSCVAQECPNKK